MRRWLALILLAGALALPALPAHADATDDLFMAVVAGNATEVKKALAAGADVDARDDAGGGIVGFPDDWYYSGDTPLYYAAANIWSLPKLSVIAALIDAGADVNARNRQGQTPLHYAAPRGNIGVLRMLLAAGANPRIPAKKTGLTPIDLAGTPEARRVLEDN